MPTVKIEGVGTVKIDAKPGTPEFDAAVDEIKQTHGGFSQPKAPVKKAPEFDPNTAPPVAMMGGMGITPQAAMGGAKELEKTALYKGGEKLEKAGAKLAEDVEKRPFTTAGQIAGSPFGPVGTGLGTYAGRLVDEVYQDPYNQKTSGFQKMKGAAAEGLVMGVLDKTVGAIIEHGKPLFDAVFGTGGRKVEQVAAGKSLELVEAGGKSVKEWFESKMAARAASYKSAESEMVRSQADALGIKLTNVEKVGAPPTREEIAKKKIEGALKDAADIIASPKPTMEGAAKGVKSSLEEAKKAFHAKFTEDYQALDNLVESKAPKTATKSADEMMQTKFGPVKLAEGKTTTGTVSGGNIAKNFENLSQTSRQVEMRGLAPKIYEPKPFEKAVMADIEALPSMPFSKAHQLRSDLLTKARMWEGGVNSRENLEVAERGIKAIDQEMSRAAKSAGEEVYQTWRNLNSAYKDGQKVFESDLITGLAAAKPEELVASIAPGKMGMTDAKTIMDALAYNPKSAVQATREFQRVYAENLLKGGDPFDLKKRLGAVGPETLGTIFGRTPEASRFLGSLNANAQLLERIAESQTKTNVARHALYGGTTTKGAILTKFGHIALDKYNDVLASATVKMMENDSLKKSYFNAMNALANATDEKGMGMAGNALAAVYRNAIVGKNEKKKP
jgi:hypothetical protein